MVSNLLNRRLFVFLLLVPFFIPMALQYIPATAGLYGGLQYWKILDVFLIVLIYLCRYKCRFSYLDYLVVFFGLFYIFTSFVNGVPATKPLSNAMLSIGVVFLVRLSRDVNQNVFFRCIVVCSLLSFVLNFLVTIVFPNGIYIATLYRNWSNPVYLYATDNGVVKFLILPIFLFFMEYAQIRKRKLFLVLNAVIAVTTIVFVDSAAGLSIVILYLVVGMWGILYLHKEIPRGFLIVMLIAVELVVVVLGSSFGVIDEITSLLGREANFTGRDYLWGQAVHMIGKSSLYGYGYSDGLLGVWGGFYSSHNLYLELILHGGWGLLVLFAVMSLYAVRKLKEKSFFERNFIFFALLCFWIDGLFEVGVSHTYYFFLAFAVYGFQYNYVGDRK